jgi:hypothetical protein
VDKTRAVYTSPLTFSEKYLSPKGFFKAPNVAVAYLMHLLTTASEVREQTMIEHKYLKLSLNSTNPVPSTRKRDVSAAAYA